jgi:hypothetical protein
MNRFLVIAAVGDASLHRRWLQRDNGPSFDTMLIDYGSGTQDYERDATYYLRARGLKWPLIAEAARVFGDRIDGYEAIWCPDDDLEIDTSSVNEMFAIFQRYKLRFAQPSLAEGSHVWFQTTRQCPYAVLRYVDHVELGAPIFSRDAFARIAPTLGESETGWGLDTLWAHMLEHTDMAVIHSVAVRHTRAYFSGASYDGRAPMDDERRVAEKFRLGSALLRGPTIFHTVLRGDAQEYVVRLFAEELPRALASPGSWTVEVRFQIDVQGVGRWFIDTRAIGGTCRAGIGPADCALLFDSLESFLIYLEAPRQRLLPLFLGHRIEVRGRQTEARKLSRVFEQLFPYRHVEAEDI